MFDNAKLFQTDTLSGNGYTEPTPEPEQPENPPVDPDPDNPNPDDPNPDDPDEPEVPEQGGNAPSTGEVKPTPSPDEGFEDVEGVEPTDPDNGSTSDGSGWT